MEDVRHPDAPGTRCPADRRLPLLVHPVVVGAVIVAGHLTGVGPLWLTDAPIFGALVVIANAGVYVRVNAAGRRDTWRRSDPLFAFVLLVALARTCMALQYGGLALGRPLVDGSLAAGDAFLGIDVPALTRWTASRAWLLTPLRAAYLSMLPQLLVPLIVLPLRRDREALWEYLFHFHLCLTVTVACMALWPAVGVHWWYGFAPLVDQHRIVDHVTAVRAGSLRHVDMLSMDGLISFPSFHAASAMFMTWAYRRHRGVLIPAAILNAGLVAATVLLGIHYAVDVLGSVVLVAVSLTAYRWWGVRWVAPVAHGEPARPRPHRLPEPDGPI